MSLSFFGHWCICHGGKNMLRIELVKEWIFSFKCPESWELHQDPGDPGQFTCRPRGLLTYFLSSSIQEECGEFLLRGKLTNRVPTYTSNVTLFCMIEIQKRFIHRLKWGYCPHIWSLSPPFFAKLLFVSKAAVSSFIFMCNPLWVLQYSWITSSLHPPTHGLINQDVSFFWNTFLEWSPFPSRSYFVLIYHFLFYWIKKISEGCPKLNVVVVAQNH